MMGIIFIKWACTVLLCCFLITFRVYSGLHIGSKVRGVNLGGWLVIDCRITPSLFDGIPNGDMLDGTQVQIKSVTLQKYVSAENGGGMNVTVDRDVPASWETFRLWRVSESTFQFRTTHGQFLTCDGGGSTVSATGNFDSSSVTFEIKRKGKNRIHIKKCYDGPYLQVTAGNQLTADYPGEPGWDDDSATFEMTIAANNLRGEYQLINGYGHNNAVPIVMWHRDKFVTMEDFKFLSEHGINTVRIPVGWWITDPDPPNPYIVGSLNNLDFAFSWAQEYDLKCIIDLHTAPGSQNGMDHSSSIDGFTEWPTSPEYISKSLRVIEILISSAGDNVQSIYKSREGLLQAFNNSNGPHILIGEWVNEWNVANGSKTDYQNFGKAQLDVYNAASFGRCYWTLKTDRKHWDFEWNIRNNYLQLGNSPSKKSISTFGCTWFCLRDVFRIMI